MRTLRLVVFVLSCGLAAPTLADGTRDPWENFNRKSWAFNDALDRWILQPVARGYRAVMPGPVDRSISRFFVNVGDLPDVVDFALQGEWSASGSSFARFLGNSTIGIGGLFDPVGRWGLPNRDTNFGITLGKWGVGSGPYLVLPFFGSSTVRGTVAIPADWALDPVDRPWSVVEHWEVRLGLGVIDVVDSRADLLAYEDLVIGDRYSFLRDAYLQRLDYDVHGAAQEDPFLDDDFLDDDFPADEEALPAAAAEEESAVSNSDSAGQPAADSAAGDTGTATNAD